ncbi:MAG: hypothetical protein K5839_05185, partial [Treponemataceae bacterium]|nr:hypothetical protein [Treponemataceae bacterium]
MKAIEKIEEDCHCHEHEHGHEHEAGHCHHEHEHHHEHSGCSCGHCHHHDEDENHTALFVRLGLSIFFLLAVFLAQKVFSAFDALYANFSIENSTYQFLIELAFYLIPFFIAGYDVLWEALTNLFHGELLDEEFLMALATVGALAIGEFPEASFVMIFYQIGEFFNDFASEKTRTSVSKLMDINP